MAGNRIKGITIEFNADPTPLGRALRKINDQAKGLDKDLRAVNTALKFNPKNTELIAQKQTLLKQKIQQTKTQLEAYRAAQAKLDDDPSVDKTSAEYMELRRQIITTESKLRHFNSELKKLETIKFEQIGQSVKDAGDKMTTVGDTMTKRVTAPILAVGAASVKAFNEVDAGLDIVAQKTGASGAALKGMQESVKNLAQEIPTDFETAGAAVGEVNTRFGLTGKALEDLSGQFIKFSKLNNTDVSNSVDLTQKAMAAFNMEADQAGEMLDILNKAGQDTGAGVDELAESMVKNAPALQAMGLDAKQSAVFLGQLEKTGADSSKVMTGLQRALVNGAKAGKDMPAVMEEIQKSIVGAKSDTEAMSKASELFGTKAGPAIATAARSGALDFQALSTAALDAAGSVSKTFAETQDPIDNFTKIANSLKITGAEIGASLMELLAPALEKISAGLQKVLTWWQSLDEGQQDMIIKIALVVAALGPLVSVLGRITKGVGTIIQLLPMLASPAGIAVAAIAGIIAIGVALYKNWDAIKRKAGELKDWVVGKWQALKDRTASIFQSIKDGMLRPINAAKDAVKRIIDKIKSFFDFDFHLPKLKIPHFSIQPPGWRLRDLLEGEIPRLGIEWYKTGGIFDRPSVIGVGEAGPEAVLPIDRLSSMLNGMADSIVNGILTGARTTGGVQQVTIPIYLYPSGPKMGEETVKMYDRYKRQLG